jgi:formylglycine-generating enzyme required for sulfatase activity
MNRRNLILGTTGLALGISGCSNSSNGPSSVPAKKVTLDDCPALKAYIDSLCDIPGGTFMMGSNEIVDEIPIHQVPISAFRMGKTPVTVAMFEEYVSHSDVAMPPEPDPEFDGARKFNIGWKDKDHPIVNVNWEGCKGFATWASEVSGVKLTLPSEARWEYACRGGRDGFNFPWGDEFDRSKLWCSGEKIGDRGSTGSVNRRVYIWLDHPWGLIDMVGNVWEWCEDWYDPNWYKIPQSKEKDVVNLDSSPTVKVEYFSGKSDSGPTRCVRGGSWFINNPDFFRCAIRYRFDPDFWGSNFGFRLSAGPK